ncbi:MAG: iron ABC transporter permease [Desulfurococcales archaeon]|nr:iron ABC transporter permease [Desulfurococcales archaeon]
MTDKLCRKCVPHTSLRKLLTLVSLLVVLALLIPLSASVGLYGVSFLDAFKVLLGHKLPESEAVALWLRLRRCLVGVITGMLLAGGGAIMQAVLRNPLASPFTLGISHAAALGVAVALMTGSAGCASMWFTEVTSPYVLPIFAFIFALSQSMLVLLLAQKGGLEPRTIILSAIAMAFTYQAILALLQYLVLNELQIATIVFWMFGDLSRAGDTELQILSLAFPPLGATYMLLHADLDLISISDDVALSSGVIPRRVRLVATVVSTLGAALATSFVGILAFLCLIAPHIARLLVGASHRYLIPTAMVVGSILLIVADITSRTVLSPVTLPVGIVLSFIGAPVLIALLVRGGGHGRY